MENSSSCILCPQAVIRPELEFSLCCCRSSIFHQGSCPAPMPLSFAPPRIRRWQLGRRLLQKTGGTALFNQPVAGPNCNGRDDVVLAKDDMERYFVNFVNFVNFVQPRKSLSFSRPRAPLRVNQILLAARRFALGGALRNEAKNRIQSDSPTQTSRRPTKSQAAVSGW